MQYASNPSGRWVGSMVVFISKRIPSALSSWIRRSMIFLFSLKLGIPKRSSPPGASALSNRVTVYPFRFSWLAAASPAGPAPITATCFPLRCGITGMTYPSRKAASMIAASFSRIVTGSSQDSFNTQLFSQSAGQIRPVNSGKSHVAASIS